jgi:hypothetical protein
MGKQYIGQVYESPEKNQTWEKSPKSCHMTIGCATEEMCQGVEKPLLTWQLFQD